MADAATGSAVASGLMVAADPMKAMMRTGRPRCIRCGTAHAPYRVPLPLGGSLDARSETLLCDGCWNRFVVHCAVFFGIDLPTEPWGGVSWRGTTDRNAGGHAP